MTAIGDTRRRSPCRTPPARSIRSTAPAVVVFTCNHCPYALAWHDRIAAAARDYPDVHFYAINPNDAERYPRDSLEAMRERVEREDWPMPYLHDESQDVARAFGAKTTPDVFVVDADGAAALPRRAGRRPPGPEASNAELAARRAQLPARRRGRGTAGDRSGRLQRQVEAVIARIAASVSLRS